jgi:nitrite reductase/ring-hydroxylating ferredoxin subunit
VHRMDGDDWRAYPAAPKSGTVLCALDEIDDGSARVFSFGNGWPILEIVVVRQESAVRGYVNVCAHLPLPLNIGKRVRTAGQLLFCDHHYAAFRFNDGYCVEGACRGLSLTTVPLRIDDGRVLIA